MKVLWFALTPCSAIELLAPKHNRGGWLKSLSDKLIENDTIELSICFYWSSQIEPFNYKGVSFYPVYRKSHEKKLYRYISKYFSVKNKDVEEVAMLLSVVNKVNPSIIHIHGTEENFGLIQSKTNIPCVISIQGILLPYVQKYYDGMSKSIVNKNTPLKIFLKYKPIEIIYNEMRNNSVREKKILGISKYIIGRTEWDKRVTQLIANKSKYYIGQEMLRNEFYKKTWQKPCFGETVEIVTTSSSSIFKGVETIVKTAMLLIEFEVAKFNWTVIGVDEKTPIVKILKNWLRVDFNKLNINFIGSKNGDEISDFLINSDIYCQCSHIENSPNSLCEAMLVGMPIVASFAGGTSSLIENNKEGILVQTGDQYAFAGAIKDLIQNQQIAIQFAENARKRALIRHNPNDIVKELISTYSEIAIENRQKI